MDLKSTDDISSQNKNYTGSLAVLTTLFFMWGFITCMNDILIPYLKKIFVLSYTEIMLVQFVFFGAYFVGSVVYFIISSNYGDPIDKIGFKKGILIGLAISAAACILFYPAAEFKSYPLSLASLFILGLGFTLLQITANPLVAAIGNPDTASGRLNLAQGLNSFGTTIAPIIGGFLVFSFFAKIGEPLKNVLGNPVLTDAGQPISANGVIIPYFIFAGMFLLTFALIYFSKIPEPSETRTVEKGAGALKFRHLKLGMIAIFVYVGAEVCIGSFFLNFMNDLNKMPEMTAKSFLAFYWGGAMIGRFLGAISLGSGKSVSKKFLFMTLTSLGFFLLIYIILLIESKISNNVLPGFVSFLPYLIFIFLNLVAFIFGKSLPHRSLFVFALFNVALTIAVMITEGSIMMWAMIGIGIFNSIMWSNIFTLAIKDLGKFTSQGSSLLVMMILGGAILPLIMGVLVDNIGIHLSFIVPALSYIYLSFYGFNGYKVTNK